MEPFAYFIFCDMFFLRLKASSETKDIKMEVNLNI